MDALMADLTALDTSYMASTCRILRQECTQVAGRTVCGDEEIVATVACQGVVSGTAPREGAGAGRMDAEVEGTLYLDVLSGPPDVQSGDRIEFVHDGQATLFDVMGDPWLGTYDTSLQVRVKHEG